MGSAAKSKIRIVMVEDEVPLSKETTQRESAADTLSRVKMEMAKPRVAKSAQFRES